MTKSLLSLLGLTSFTVAAGILIYPVPYNCIPYFQPSDTIPDYTEVTFQCQQVPRIFAVLFPDPNIIQSAQLQFFIIPAP